MKDLLDTDAVIAILKGNGVLVDRLLHDAPADFGLPSVVLHELVYGAFKGQRTDETLRRIDGLGFEVLPFDGEEARTAGEVRASLAKAGMPIGPFDVLIAGQAISRDLVLITRTMREFGRIPTLLAENWEGET